jgi:hypothetical protein
MSARDTWHNQRITGVRQIQHFRHMKVTNQSDTWQDLTRVKPCVTSAEASMIGTVHLRDRCQRSRHRRHIGHREIGIPEIKGNERSKASKSRRYRDRPSKGQVSKIWRVRIWPIGNSPGECIEATKTPKPRWSDMTEVTSRQVIWIMI